MYRITYYNREAIVDEDWNLQGYKTVKRTYDCDTEEFFNEMFVLIKKQHGQWGEVTYGYFPDEPTAEELEKEELKAEIKTLKEQLLEVQKYVINKEYNNLLENGGMKNVI